MSPGREAGPWFGKRGHSVYPEGSPVLATHVAATTEELLGIFDKFAAQGRTAIDSASDEEMGRTWTFSYAGQPGFARPKSVVFRECINHLPPTGSS